MAFKRKGVHIKHTRMKRSTNIINIRADNFNPNTLIVDFEHSLPTNYYIADAQIIYGMYIDREYIKEFLEKSTKFQLAAVDVNHVLEVFAHPHGGFQFIRNELTPGNKIRIQFQAKRPDLMTIPVQSHKIYWDNATGTLLTAVMGEVNASDGVVSGRYLKTGTITQ